MKQDLGVLEKCIKYKQQKVGQKLSGLKKKKVSSKRVVPEGTERALDKQSSGALTRLQEYTCRG